MKNKKTENYNSWKYCLFQEKNVQYLREFYDQNNKLIGQIYFYSYLPFKPVDVCFYNPKNSSYISNLIECWHKYIKTHPAPTSYDQTFNYYVLREFIDYFINKINKLILFQ